MKFLLPLLAMVGLAGCQVDPATLFKQQGETVSLTPTSAPRYERVGPLPDTMDGVAAALKIPGNGVYATGRLAAHSSDGGEASSLAPQEPLDVISIGPEGIIVTVNRKILNTTISVPRGEVEIGRLAYATPQ